MLYWCYTFAYGGGGRDRCGTTAKGPHSSNSGCSLARLIAQSCQPVFLVQGRMAQTTTSPGADDPATPGDRRASNSDDESSGTSVSPHDVPDLREGCLSRREQGVALGRLDVP